MAGLFDKALESHAALRRIELNLQRANWCRTYRTRASDGRYRPTWGTVRYADGSSRYLELPSFETTEQADAYVREQAGDAMTRIFRLFGCIPEGLHFGDKAGRYALRMDEAHREDLPWVRYYEVEQDIGVLAPPPRYMIRRYRLW